MLQGLPLANRCCMCCCSMEFVDHLFIHCHVVYSLWVQMLQALGFNGSCQVLWRVWCLVGVIGWGNLLWTYGIWFLAVWCGLFGWKETGAFLRLWRERLISYKLSAKILFLNGLGAGVLQTVLLFWSFFLPLEVPLKLLFLFFFLFCLLFFVFTIMNTCICCFRSFMMNISLINYQKKKKKSIDLKFERTYNPSVRFWKSYKMLLSNNVIFVGNSIVGGGGFGSWISLLETSRGVC